MDERKEKRKKILNENDTKKYRLRRKGRKNRILQICFEPAEEEEKKEKRSVWKQYKEIQ